MRGKKKKKKKSQANTINFTAQGLETGEIIDYLNVV
jgi:hypothetical protein